MSTLMEVQVLNHIIVLPCDEHTTVADITAAAVSEYRSFNLKKSPQKVLFTRDSTGRVLSGLLKIIQNKISSKLEVVISEHTSEDLLSPTEIVTVYRDWQLWVANQIQEAIYLLSIEENPSHPDAATLYLLHELCDSPEEKVQLLCVRILKTLLTKFSQKTLVVDAAEKISKVFMRTAHADVAVAAIESFKGLSPLQAKVFNSAKYVREMLDVQTALVRFSVDKQSMLFGAFETVSSIIGDQELNTVMNRTDEGFVERNAPTAQLPFSAGQKSKRVNFMYEVETELTVGTEVDALQPTDQSLPAPAPAPVPFGATTKRINLKRLESLLSSEDAKVRLFALEKLSKLLSQASIAHSSANHELSSPYPAPAHSEASPGSVQPTEGPVVMTAAARSAHPTSEYLFTFTDGKEVDSIVKCLFRCLKQCIHSRPKRGGVAVIGPAAVSEKEREREGDKTQNNHSNGSVVSRAVTASSTAGRLIQTALQSPLTDEPAVLLIVDCLYQIAHFPADISLSAGVQFPPGVLHTHRRKLKMDGRELSNIQLVFILAAREWYRLLLTLAHADEGSKLLRYADLAEKSAYFFVLVVLHGMEKGWREAELTLDASAVLSFLSGKHPSFRSYVGMSYLTSLSTSCFPNSGQHGGGSGSGSSNRLEGAWSVESKQHHKDSLESQVLQNLLMYRSAEVARSLWRWVSEGDHSSRKSMLLALDCLSSCCVFSSFTSIMYKMDPITRLAALLQIAVRDEKAEAQEFAVGRDSVSRPVSRSSPAQQEADGDWDSGKEAYRIAILPDELSDDEDNASSHMLDNLSFAGGFGVAGLPDSPLPAAVPVGVSGVPEESALSRLMNRKGGINAAAAAVLSKASSGEAFVYPDVPLIRLILKMMANLLGASNSSVAYSEDFRGELANWLLEVDVGPADSAENRVKLKRIAKKDQIVMFYFNSITQY